MTGFTRIAAVLASITASTTGVLGSAAALASPAPTQLVAQTTVPTEQPISPGQQRFFNPIDPYGLEAGGDLPEMDASEGRISTASPACITGCQPWFVLHQRL